MSIEETVTEARRLRANLTGVTHLKSANLARARLEDATIPDAPA